MIGNRTLGGCKLLGHAEFAVVSELSYNFTKRLKQLPQSAVAATNLPYFLITICKNHK
jgi:hypothetical protein